MNPPVDRDVIYINVTLGKQLTHIPIAKPVAQVPTHGQDDHIRWESEPRERQGNINNGPGTATTTHPMTIAVDLTSVNATVPNRVLFRASLLAD